MPRGFLVKNNFTKETILKIAAVAGASIIIASSPFLLNQIVKQYFKEKNAEIKRKRAKKLRELQKRKIIEFKELGNGEIKVVLSHKGKDLVRQYKLDDIKIKKPAKWDGYWRILIYDIPASQRKASNALSEKLKNIDFRQLQKSVWVFPYEFLPEIEFICAVFEINMDKYVSYFKTKEIPREKEFKKFFDLK
jgi:DNA-binding transcriptional regulator PaaX